MDEAGLDLWNTETKLGVAVDGLVGTGDLKRRLENSLVSSLIHLQPRDFPTDLVPLFTSIEEQVTAISDPKKGSVVATLARMSDDQLQRLAERIVNLYGQVCAARGAAESQKP